MYLKPLPLPGPTLVCGAKYPLWVLTLDSNSLHGRVVTSKLIAILHAIRSLSANQHSLCQTRDPCHHLLSSTSSPPSTRSSTQAIQHSQTGVKRPNPTPLCPTILVLTHVLAAVVRSRILCNMRKQADSSLYRCPVLSNLCVRL